MKDDERELLARLQAQFGDMDVGGMLEGSTSAGNEYGRGDEDDEEDDGGDSESSLDEPTAEELRIWQEAQFEKGRTGRNVLKSDGAGNKHRSALQSRRQHKTTSQMTLMREYNKSEEANDWVKLASTPDLGGESSVFFPNIIESDNSDVSDLVLAGGVNPLLQQLVEGDPEVLGSKWTRLFSSSDGDGLSFRNLCDKIRGYDGPTLLLIGGVPSASKFVSPVVDRDLDDDRVSLGFFTTDSWIESTEYFGTDDCFLFAMDHKENKVRIVRPKDSIKNPTMKRYMYCHPSSFATSRMRGFDGQNITTNGSVHGIGIGGTASQPRLHITESLEECRALAYDRLFDDEDLLLGKCNQSLFYFDIDCIEVWAVGGDEWISDALRAQKQAKQILAANLKKARTVVEKVQFLDDFQTGLTSATKQGIFGHRDLVSERCDL